MFGYESPTEMIRQVTDIPRQIFIVPDQRVKLIDKARTTTGFVCEQVDYRRRDGSEFVANLYMRMLRDPSGDTTCLEGFVEDVTERKRAEDRVREYQENLEKLVDARTAELRETNERLLREIEERTRAEHELEVAKERAEAADRLKSAFLATMSHELRTPLNSIIGFTGILLQKLSGPLNPEQEKQLGMVRNSANHLLALISDILDISKIEAGQLTMACAPFPMDEAILRVVQTIRPLAEKKGLALSVQLADDVRTMTGDVRRMEQILLNLLSNAVKFTEQGEVTVSCAREAGVYRIVVRDTGIGIGTEDLGKLFKPFRQIDSGIDRKYEGTGLGLSICKRLVEMMGGSIQVESQPGVGSSFSFSLPVERVSI
jgi:PAS domain S-box-containing protein